LGIQLDKQACVDAYERAIRDARNPRTKIDQTWAGRVRWLSEQVAGGDAKGKTYIPAVGGALLAKAVDPRIDTLPSALKADRAATTSVVWQSGCRSRAEASSTLGPARRTR
jgi:hypothetical protein